MEINIEHNDAKLDVNVPYRCGTEINLSKNLEFWMTNLPLKLRLLPLIHLAIPGSHNSMTYTIERNNDVGPDESAAIVNLALRFPRVIKSLIFNWSINQKETIVNQLNGGIRYLDLRVATKVDKKFYFLHGLYGAEVSQPLRDVADWLSVHPNEIIIMDFQHFYDFNEEDHKTLISQVQYVFQNKMCPVNTKMESISLEWLSTEHYQVIIIYRNRIACNYNNLWYSSLWPTPWPNTVKTVRLINFLNDGLKMRIKNNGGFVSQCLLTPDSIYIAKHLCGNFYDNLFEKCQNVTLPWIKQHSPGNGGMNIVITDYVSFDNFLFSKTVIQRNATLLEL